MRTPSSIHFSRAGDYFHYVWAAYRCLPLLSETSGLKAVVIEGVSGSEFSGRALGQSHADEVIDVAEYFGSEDPMRASAIQYSQLKHSNQQLDKPWTPSLLKDVLKGLFEKYQESKSYPGDICYSLVTNRPVSARTVTLFERLRHGARTKTDRAALTRISSYVDAKTESDVVAFLNAFEIDDSHGNYRQTRARLAQEVQAISPGAMSSVTSQLVSLVFERVLPDSAARPEIRRADLLEALNTHLTKLYPAPSRINIEGELVPREQEPAILDMLRSGADKVIIEAEGGQGKTALTLRLDTALSENGWCVTYDCFGNGEYRSPRHERFEHRRALMQIANELAGMGLCQPIVPNADVSRSDMLRAFMARLTEAVAKAREAGGKEAGRVFILIDAADNAEMAAQEFGRPGSFARDLARETIPEGVTCVFLCRPERTHLLGLHALTPTIRLGSFSLEETERLLRSHYPEATDADVSEFHFLTDATPRTQAAAIAKGQSLRDMLISFGPDPVTVEDVIRDVFETALDKVRDSLPDPDAKTIDRLCAAIAALRPFIPINVLARVSNVPSSLIRSFVHDVGRPLVSSGGAIQFFDEPSETWFRDRYAPDEAQMADFVTRLEPLADDNAYVAAALPDLLHRVGRDADLVEAILTDEKLPEDDPVERRQIALQRMIFALKSALNDCRNVDAAKLAYKLAGETAGKARQDELIQNNVHLFGHVMSAEMRREYVSRMPFSTEWHGGHFAYAASLMSWDDATFAEARSNLQVALTWLNHWAGKHDDESKPLPRTKGKVTRKDAATLSEAVLNVAGPEAFARHVGAWTDKSRAFDIAHTVCERLATLGDLSKLHAIAESSGHHPPVLLAAVDVLIRQQEFPSRSCAERLVRFRSVFERAQSHRAEFGYEHVAARTATAVALTVLHHGLMTKEAIGEALGTHHPSPKGYAETAGLRYHYIQKCKASALMQRFKGEDPTVGVLISGDLRKKWDAQDQSRSHDRDLRFFRFVEEHIMPWCTLRADYLLGRVPPETLLNELTTLSRSRSPDTYDVPQDCARYQGEIATCWMDMLLWHNKAADIDPDHAAHFIAWVRQRQGRMFTPALRSLVAGCSRISALYDFAHEIATWIEPMMREDNSGAEGLVDEHAATAQALFGANRDEAEIYLEKAAIAAAEIGQENHDRLHATILLAKRAATIGEERPDLAHRFARVSEHAYQFMARDKYWPRQDIVDTIGRLSPSSLFSILARWKDRRFGWPARCLHQGVEALIDAKRIDVREAQTLLGYDYGWEHAVLFPADGSAAPKTDAARAELSQHLALSEYGDNEGFSPEWAHRKTTFTTKPNRRQRERSRYSSPALSSSHSMDRDTLVAGLDLDDPADIVVLRERLRGAEHYDMGSRLGRLLFEDVTPNRRASRLRAVFASDALDRYNVGEVLNALPPSWFGAESLARLLRERVLGFVADTDGLFAYYPHDPSFPFSALEALCGLSRQDILAAAIPRRANGIHLAGSGNLFNLIGLLCHQLSETEATDVLEFCLSSSEAEIAEGFGDGPYTDQLEPPTKLEDAVALYIWSGLASPHRPDRWRAMHAVCLAIVLQRNDIVRTLCVQPSQAPNLAFHGVGHDVRTLSARVSLLHAVRRAVAKGWPLSEDVLGMLREACAPKEQHALIRQLAAWCLLDLSDRGLAAVSDSERGRLSTINTLVGVNTSATTKDDEASERLYFGHDLDEWVSDMGRAVGLGYHAARRATMDAMITRFEHTEERRFDRDVRAARGLYRDRETWNRRHGPPETEDLDFYITVHAAHYVAGTVIDKHKGEQNGDSPRALAASDRVQSWLLGHCPTDRRGYWLADWRNPEPDLDLRWETEIDDTAWSMTTSRDELDRWIGSRDGQILVSADMTFYNEHQGRTRFVSVTSALVTAGPEGISLLRAFQTIDDFMDFRLPDAQATEFEVDHGRFQLEALVRDRYWSKRVDAIDPWAGTIDVPRPEPAETLVEAQRLRRDEFGRSWTMEDGREAVRVVRWGEQAEDDYDRPSSGRMMVFTEEFLKDVLRARDRYLLVCVSVRRSVSDKRGQTSSSAGEMHISRSHLLALIDYDGAVHYA